MLGDYSTPATIDLNGVTMAATLAARTSNAIDTSRYTDVLVKYELTRAGTGTEFYFQFEWGTAGVQFGQLGSSISQDAANDRTNEKLMPTRVVRVVSASENKVFSVKVLGESLTIIVSSDTAHASDTIKVHVQPVTFPS